MSPVGVACFGEHAEVFAFRGGAPCRVSLSSSYPGATLAAAIGRT
jgi:hypothetical protein